MQSDNAPNLTAEVSKEFMKAAQVTKISSTAGDPLTQGQVEGQNRNLFTLLRVSCSYTLLTHVDGTKNHSAQYLSLHTAVGRVVDETKYHSAQYLSLHTAVGRVNARLLTQFHFNHQQVLLTYYRARIMAIIRCHDHVYNI